MGRDLSLLAERAAHRFQEVVLIGAMCTGKTTVGRLLAARMGVDYWSTDAIWSASVIALGFDGAQAKILWERGEYRAHYDYCKSFEVALLESLPTSRGVMEIGSTFTVQDDPVLADRVVSVLRRHEHIVHLTASPDPEENKRILFARLVERSDGHAPDESERRLWRLSLDQRIAHQTATHTVYTAGLMPEAVVEAIVKYHMNGQLPPPT